MVELVYTRALGARTERCVGPSPTRGTYNEMALPARQRPEPHALAGGGAIGVKPMRVQLSPPTPRRKLWNILEIVRTSFGPTRGGQKPI